MSRKIIWIAAAVTVILMLCAGCAVFTAAAAGQTGELAQPAAPVSSAETVEPSATPGVVSLPPTASASAAATVASPSENEPYKVAVPYDLEELKNSQKSVDEGHSPWKLDAAFVAQVFVSLQLEPEGIQGDYPIPYEDFKVKQQSSADAVVEVDNQKSPTAKVYLKRLVRQEEGGIWTVVGYDPK